MRPDAGEVAMAHTFTLNVDGSSHTIAVDDPEMPLLYALRDDIGLNNPRFGCGLGQCGACTVHIDGQVVRSCITPLSVVGDRRITTLAGLGTSDNPHPIQKAWLDEQVSQCAYCINGWIMTAAALLNENPHPSESEIKEALSTLICRCGTHGAAIRAVRRAAQSA
jgi:nicotinate dehydrogenase subunit A